MPSFTRIGEKCWKKAVGAVINRPRSTAYEFAQIQCKFVPYYCRADAIRPYIFMFHIFSDNLI